MFDYIYNDKVLKIVRVAGIMFLLFTLVFYIPFAIANVVLYSKKEEYCNNTDQMGLSPADYLLGMGISYFILFLAGLLLVVFGFIAVPAFVLILQGYFLFSLAWFIIGAIIIFRSNLTCLKKGSPLVAYAFALWLLSAIYMMFFIKPFLSRKKKLNIDFSEIY